jgi:hypothetical protein
LETSPQTAPTRGRSRRRIFYGFLLLLAVGLFLLPRLAAPWVKGRAVGAIEQQLAVEARIEELSLSWSGAARLGGVALDDLEGRPLARLQAATMKLEIRPLLSGELHAHGVVEGLDVQARRNALGEIDWTKLAKLPSDTVFFTQITMEAAEDPEFLEAMRKANIKGALIGVEAVTPSGLKDIYKDFNLFGEELAERLRTFRRHGVHVLGSFIFGLPSDTSETFDATAALAESAEITFAQFVMLTPFPGTIDFDKWEKSFVEGPPMFEGTPLTRHWLIPPARRPKYYMPHPKMSQEEVRQRTQAVWDRFYSLPVVWKRSRCVPQFKGRLAFVLISKLYRQMYANTGIASDSARQGRAQKWARIISKPTAKFFAGRPMPDLQVPS